MYNFSFQLRYQTTCWEKNCCTVLIIVNSNNLIYLIIALLELLQSISKQPEDK